MNAPKSLSGPRRTTPVLRVLNTRYLHETRNYQGKGTLKHELMMLFDKGNQEHMAFLTQLEQDAVDVQAQYFPGVAPPFKLLGGSHDFQVRDGDIAFKKDRTPYVTKMPYVANTWFATAKAIPNPQFPLGVYRSLADGSAEPLLPGGTKDGDWGRVSMNVYVSANGVYLGLEGFIKDADGEFIQMSSGTAPFDPMASFGVNAPAPVGAPAPGGFQQPAPAPAAAPAPGYPVPAPGAPAPTVPPAPGPSVPAPHSTPVPPGHGPAPGGAPAAPAVPDQPAPTAPAPAAAPAPPGAPVPAPGQAAPAPAPTAPAPGQPYFPPPIGQ